MAMTMPTTRTQSSSRRPRGVGFARIFASAAALIACTLASRADAGGLFDFLFGAPQRAAIAYSDPRADFAGRGEQNRADIRVETPAAPVAAPVSSGRAFCVRLCDGRYYPIASAASNSTPVQMCSAMCPAAETKVFRGGEIASAADSTGARYGRLQQAFAYRKSVVPGCTCNGKDPFGLVHVEVATDPTLRPGDLVATADGLKPFQGGRTAGKAANAAGGHLSALREQQ